MNTAYQPVVSPYQKIRAQALDVRAPKHPVMDEINKCVGQYGLEISVEEDRQTLAMFKHVPGLIAFIATIQSNGRIVGQGRGSASLSSTNRFIERAVHCAFNSAIVDAIVRSTKVLDVLLPASSVLQDMEMPESNMSYAVEPFPAQERFPAKMYAPIGVTEKQKVFLRRLASMNILDKGKREEFIAGIDAMTKSEASEMIQKMQ